MKFSVIQRLIHDCLHPQREKLLVIRQNLISFLTNLYQLKAYDDSQFAGACSSHNDR